MSWSSMIKSLNGKAAQWIMINQVSFASWKSYNFFFFLHLMIFSKTLVTYYIRILKSIAIQFLVLEISGNNMFPPYNFQVLGEPLVRWSQICLFELPCP